MADLDARRRLAADLLDLRAVLFAPDEPFTWASGLRSPIYCDNRLTLSDPAVRGRIADGFAALLDAHGYAPDVVVGTATAGIPHAAWLAERRSLPMAYVRSAPKGHGRGNQIEGRVEAGQRVVLVEDLVSTGGSALTAVEALRAAGAEVLAVLAVFSYGFPAAADAFDAAGVPLHTLTDYPMLLEEARRQARVPAEAVETLAAWQRDPAAWSARITG